MQGVFEKNCTIVLLTARSYVTPTAFKNVVEKHVFGLREGSELFWLPLKALVSVEKPVSVEDGPLRNASLHSEGKK